MRKISVCSQGICSFFRAYAWKAGLTFPPLAPLSWWEMGSRVSDTLRSCSLYTAGQQTHDPPQSTPVFPIRLPPPRHSWDLSAMFHSYLHPFMPISPQRRQHGWLHPAFQLVTCGKCHPQEQPPHPWVSGVSRVKVEEHGSRSPRSCSEHLVWGSSIRSSGKRLVFSHPSFAGSTLWPSFHLSQFQSYSKGFSALHTWCFFLTYRSITMAELVQGGIGLLSHSWHRLLLAWGWLPQPQLCPAHLPFHVTTSPWPCMQ